MSASAQNLKLDAIMDGMLRLAIRTKRPPIAGGINLKAKLVIPPDDVDVVRKLRFRVTSP